MFQKKTLTDQDLKELKRLYKDDLENQIEKVKKGYPVQYLIGNVPFFNMSLYQYHVIFFLSLLLCSRT